MHQYIFDLMIFIQFFTLGLRFTFYTCKWI